MAVHGSVKVHYARDTHTVNKCHRYDTSIITVNTGQL